MAAMDSSQSALDSLRTVEFRETLKGYHRDDVDEYLERAAIEAEGLQEQLRQSGERLRQAAERITQLETDLERVPEPMAAEPAVPDDTLQRTLLLAQKFVDETKADAEARAGQILADADTKARMLTDEAETKAAQISAESKQRLREDIGRLEETRGKLAQDVEMMSRQLESERDRLRKALGDMLKWVDDNVRPAPSSIDLRGREAPVAAAPRPAPQPAAARPPAEAERPAQAAPQGAAQPARMTEVPQGGANPRSPSNAPLPL
jgi:DivIVA domain-containing protein